MGRRILITGGKGGTGKSSVCCMLAYALSELGKSVLLIDLDEGLRCLDLMTGVSDSIVFDVSDCISGEADIEMAAKRPISTERLFVLAAPANAGELDGSALAELVEAASADYDFILLDSPAGFGGGFTAGAMAADEAVCVIQSDALSARDADCTRRELLALGINQCSMIINKFQRSLISKRICPDIDDMIDSAGLRLYGIIPYDKKVSRLTASGKVVLPVKKIVPNSAAAAAYRIARRLNGEDVPLPQINNI